MKHTINYINENNFCIDNDFQYRNYVKNIYLKNIKS